MERGEGMKKAILLIIICVIVLSGCYDNTIQERDAKRFACLTLIANETCTNYDMSPGIPLELDRVGLGVYEYYIRCKSFSREKGTLITILHFTEDELKSCGVEN